jgi:hypothetical protein
MAKATGANLTLSGGDTSFEQALLSAQLWTNGDKPVIVAGADENHVQLSPLFDPSAAGAAEPSDGGGMLILKRSPDTPGPRVTVKYFAAASEDHSAVRELVARLGGAGTVPARYGLILAGLPAACRVLCRGQLDVFKEESGCPAEVIDYRRLTGEFAASTAVAAVFAASLVQAGRIPETASEKGPCHPHAGAVLILGLGTVLSAIEVSPP